MKSPEFFLYGEDLLALLKSVIEKGADFRFQARGGSMYPFIKDSDIITLSPVRNKLSMGDIIAFISPVCKKLRVHRIISVKDDIYKVKGDNLKDFDGEVEHVSVIAYVTGIERHGKKITFGFGQEKFLIAFLNRINAIYFFSRLKEFFPAFR